MLERGTFHDVERFRDKHGNIDRDPPMTLRKSAVHVSFFSLIAQKDLVGRAGDGRIVKNWRSLMAKRALIITADTGVERDELLKPKAALESAGHQVTHASPKGGDVQTFVQDTDKDKIVAADTTLSSVSEGDFDVLVIPGGTINADKLRTDKEAIALVQAFAKAGKTIASVCHGPWIFINAELAKGRTFTSYFTLQKDLENAGAVWVDRQVVRCGHGPNVVITSRNPQDLDAFGQAILTEISV
jgi:protease I